MCDPFTRPTCPVRSTNFSSDAGAAPPAAAAAAVPGEESLEGDRKERAEDGRRHIVDCQVDGSEEEREGMGDGRACEVKSRFASIETYSERFLPSFTDLLHM